jgi:hypothetical protein
MSVHIDISSRFASPRAAGSSSIGSPWTIFKQQSSFVWMQKHQQQLWQRGYFDRVLREEDDTRTVARYLLDNPVRAGIVAEPRSYPFLGSMVMDLSDLLESVRKM